MVPSGRGIRLSFRRSDSQSEFARCCRQHSSVDAAMAALYGTTPEIAVEVAENILNFLRLPE